MQPVNIQFEFSCLLKLIDDLWEGTDSVAAQLAIAAAFQQGLDDGKLWIDTSFTFSIAKILNGDNQVASPLSARCDRRLDGELRASMYDALCIFDSNLKMCVWDIYRIVTDYKRRGGFGQNADALCASLNARYGSFMLVPRDLDKALSNAIVANYAGLLGDEPGSFPTPNKFLKSYVVCSLEDQGMPLERSFFANIYSHGLYIAKAFNTGELIRTVLPHYARRDEDLNVDNGPEILSSTIHNPFVNLANQLEPFVFSSSTAYQAELQRRESDIQRPTRTPEQVKAFMREMIDRIDERAESREQRIATIVDSFYASIKPQRIAQSGSPEKVPN